MLTNEERTILGHIFESLDKAIEQQAKLRNADDTFEATTVAAILGSMAREISERLIVKGSTVKKGEVAAEALLHMTKLVNDQMKKMQLS